MFFFWTTLYCDFCVWRRVISDIKDRVTNIKDTYSSISLVVGGNDCDINTAPDDIIDQYRGLITTAKSKATNVTVSIVCPRIKSDKPELNDKIRQRECWFASSLPRWGSKRRKQQLIISSDRRQCQWWIHLGWRCPSHENCRWQT